MDKNDIKNEEEDYKIINLFEFQQKTNTVEYFLNLSLKNKKSLTIKETKQLNFTNNNGNISFPSPKEISEKKYLTEPKDQPPFNITEYKMPLNDINKISKILNSNTLFQNENQNIVELIVTEIMYLVIPKDTIIYDTNDISNFFYIINKGNANLIKKKEIKDESNNSIQKEKIITNLNEWESFGEISFFIGKKRDEEIISLTDIELYLIDSESYRELIKKNNEIILKEKYDFLNNISIFESLDKISKYNVAQKLKKKNSPPTPK